MWAAREVPHCLPTASPQLLRRYACLSPVKPDELSLAGERRWPVPELNTKSLFYCSSFLWPLPFTTAILFQAKHYAMRALGIAEAYRSVEEKRVILDLLDIISAEEECEGHPAT